MNERASVNPPDMSAFWMPFTANRQFKSAPRLLSSAKGMYYTSHDGRRILDGTAGLWRVNAGHCRDEIVTAVQAPGGRNGFRTDLPELAEWNWRRAPERLGHVLMMCSCGVLRRAC
jgi:4-aminobutyrate aminotransferase-like enzyme